MDLLKVTVKSGTSENVSIDHDNLKVVVCKATGRRWSDFTEKKSGMVEHTCEHLHKLKSCGNRYNAYVWTQWEKSQACKAH